MPDLNTTNAALALQLSTLATNWNANQAQFANWQAGTLTGGTAANGTGAGPYYPLTNAVGTVGYFLCPAGIAANSLPLTGGAVYGTITVSASSPYSASIQQYQAGGGSDQKNTRWFTTANGTGFDFINDAQSTSAAWLVVNRSGYSPTSWTLTGTSATFNLGPITTNGSLTLTGTTTGGTATTTPATFLAKAGGIGPTLNNDINIGGFQAGTGNNVFLNAHARRITGGGTDWTTVAMGLSYDVDSTVGAGGAIWFRGGNIGIGTTTPGSALDVAGNINASSITTPAGVSAAGLNTADTGNGYSVTSSFGLVGAGGSNWYANNVISRSYSASHLDSRIGQLVVSQTVGSTGSPSSPSTADYAGGLISVKLNWLSSTVAGEVDGDICYVRQGVNGDAAGRLTNIGKMGTSGGVLAHEATTSTLAADPSYSTDPSKALRLISMQTAQGFVETGGEAMGFWTEKRTGSGGTAFKSRCLDDRTAAEIANGVAAPTWDNHFAGWNARSQTYEAVRIDNLGNYFHTRSQVVGARKTGWAAPTGTASRAALASYAGQTISSTPTQSQVQALDDTVKALSQALVALLTDLYSASALDAQSTTGHGLIGP